MGGSRASSATSRYYSRMGKVILKRSEGNFGSCSWAAFGSLVCWLSLVCPTKAAAVCVRATSSVWGVR